MEQRLTAMLPCDDFDAAEAFFARLGFQREQGSLEDYRTLSDGLGGIIQPGDTPWGMHEVALNGPDETLVRVGWPTRLRGKT